MALGDEILAWKKAAEETPSVELTECPVCDWPLNKTDKGVLHCPFCGYTNGGTK